MVFSKVPNTFKDFNEVDTITPLYNVDDYAKEAKFRLEIALKRAKLLLDTNKIKQKNNYDKDILDYNFKIGDLVLLRNDIGHKLEESYKGPYKIKNIDLRNNVTIVDKKNNKEQVVHKNRLKLYNK